MPHVPETVILFLAAASIGAVFTSTSADFGADGVVDRFGQTEPKVLLAATGYRTPARPSICGTAWRRSPDGCPASSTC